ncbi:MAG TPA: response regulator [Thermoplasmatales archaeon]|nr:response regulator [Thermoplasmatales archaeon]
MTKKRIMVVDDNPDVIYTVEQSLKALDGNYEVVGVESGMECFKFLKENEVPDLILLDIMLPEMSGWEVLNRLREKPEWKNIPVVFLTARTDETARKAGGFLGEDYIEKPFQPEELKKRIDSILEKKR